MTFAIFAFAFALAGAGAPPTAPAEEAPPPATPAPEETAEPKRMVEGICTRFVMFGFDRAHYCAALLRLPPRKDGGLVAVAAPDHSAVMVMLHPPREVPFGENGTTRRFEYAIDGVVIPERPNQVILIEGTCTELLGGEAKAGATTGEAYSIQCQGKFKHGEDFALAFMGAATPVK
jgi:hypothetical protein